MSTTLNKKTSYIYYLNIVDFFDSRSIKLNEAKSLKAKKDKLLRSKKIFKLRNDPINFEYALLRIRAAALIR